MQDEKILKENYEFYLTQKKDLLSDQGKKYKFVVIYEKELKRFFDDFETAFLWAKNEYLDENFIIHQIVDESEITHFVYDSVYR